MATYEGLVPDLGTSLAQGLQTGMQLGAIGRNQAEAERQQQSRQLAGQLIAKSSGLSPEQFAALPEFQAFAQADPDSALQLQNAVLSRDKASFDMLNQRNKQQSNLIAPILLIKDPAARKIELLRQSQQFKSSQDPFDQETGDELLELANLPAEAQTVRLQQAAAQSDIGDKIFKLFEPQQAASGLGKLQADRAQAVKQFGEGSPQVQQFDAALKKETTLGGGDTPAALQEFAAYQKMSPADREAFLKVKRAERGPSSTTEKTIIESSDKAQQAEQKYVNYSDLASQYEKSGGVMQSGIKGSAAELIKELTGEQDAVSLLRKDWAAMKASSVGENLPPGAASDADVKLALSGFLPTNANPAAVASFLRGVAKLHKVQSAYNSFKSDYVSEKGVGGLNKAWKEFSKNIPVEATTSSGQVPTPQTEDEYNALPSGSMYIDPDDGKSYRKP